MSAWRPNGWLRMAAWCRQLAAAGCLLCSARIAYISMRLLGPESQVVPPRPLSATSSAAAGSDAPPSWSESAPRRDLEQLEEILEREKSLKAQGPEQTAAPLPRARRLLVDLGPARSEVYVNGVFAGRTPYLGAVSCAEGQVVRVEVLPPEGPPWQRQLRCDQNQMEARALESEPGFPRQHLRAP